MSKYVIDIPNNDGFTAHKNGYIVRIGNSILINSNIESNIFSKLTVNDAKQIDKRFEDDYIRRWRILAMLRNIKEKIYTGNNEETIAMINNYLNFIEKLDEKEWEEKFCAKI